MEVSVVEATEIILEKLFAASSHASWLYLYSFLMFSFLFPVRYFLLLMRRKIKTKTKVLFNSSHCGSLLLRTGTSPTHTFFFLSATAGSFCQWLLKPAWQKGCCRQHQVQTKSQSLKPSRVYEANSLEKQTEAYFIRNVPSLGVMVCLKWNESFMIGASIKVAWLSSVIKMLIDTEQIIFRK